MGRLRSVLTRGSIAGILAVATAVVGVVAGAPDRAHAARTGGSPAAITSMTVTPVVSASSGAFYGGSLVIRATFSGAVSCAFNATPVIQGLPVTIPCTSGSVEVPVSAAYNTGSAPQRYVVRLRTTNAAGGVSSRAVSGAVQPLPLISGVTAVAATPDSRCALVTDGAIRCWGSNDAGQLGSGSTSGPDTCPTAGAAGRPCSLLARKVVGLDGTGWLQGATALASTGAGYCAAVRSIGVVCWGSNASGQLGNGSTTGATICWSGVTCSATPTPVAARALASRSVISLTGLGSGGGVCAVTTGGHVACWGRDDAGEVGDGSPASAVCAAGPCTPQPEPVVTTFAALAGAGAPSPLSDVRTVVSAPGSSSWCAVLTWGGIDCWGDGADGALGSQRLVSSNVALPVTSALGAGLLLGAQQVTGSGAGLGSGSGSGTPAGYCARLVLGSVACWGSNGLGQLGAGGGGTSDLRCTNTDRPCSATPVLVRAARPVAQAGSTSSVGPLTSAIDIAGAASGYCVVVATGGSACWGANIAGSLGDGSTSGPLDCGPLWCSPTPVEVHSVTGSGTLTQAQSITSDGATICVMRLQARAACWGAGTRGQIGAYANPLANTPVPVQVQGVGGRSALTGIESMQQSHGSTCAILLSQGLLCWGIGSTGQLGSGASADRSLPDQVWAAN